MDATCKNCPMATPWTPTQDGKPRILCHHVASMDGGGEPERYEDWFCSEHPLRQRDRLAAMAMQALIPMAPEHAMDADDVASDAFRYADALLAASHPAPSPRSEAEGTRAPACHCGDVLRERPCPFCSPEAYYGAGRAPVPAESAARDLLRVVEHPAVPEGTAYAVSVVEGPDGEKRLDAVKVTGIGAAVPGDDAKGGGR